MVETIFVFHSAKTLRSSTAVPSHGKASCLSLVDWFWAKWDKFRNSTAVHWIGSAVCHLTIIMVHVVLLMMKIFIFVSTITIRKRAKRQVNHLVPSTKLIQVSTITRTLVWAVVQVHSFFFFRINLNPIRYITRNWKFCSGQQKSGNVEPIPRGKVARHRRLSVCQGFHCSFC